MVSIVSLWLPVVLSAVLVFVLSSILHMMLGYHRSDFRKLPNEDRTLDALRAENVPPGNYLFPCPSTPKDMSSPAMIEKYEKGPLGFMVLFEAGRPKMGKQLAQWLVFCLAVSISSAYLTGRALGPGAPYLAVFRFAGTSAFYAHGLGRVVESIWMGRPWSVTLKNVFDGLLYGLATGGTFGWLWPA